MTVRARQSDLLLESGFAYGVLRQLLAPALARLNAAERAVVLGGADGWRVVDQRFER